MFLILLCVKSFAQEVNLKGLIISDEGESVKIAVVELTQNGVSQIKISDSLGYFNFKIKPGRTRLKIKHLSFNEFVGDFYVYSDTFIVIYLFPKPVNFDEVVVTATRYEANAVEISNFVEIINSKTIDRTHPISFSDVLKSATSIYARDYSGTLGGLKTISLRGTGSEQTVFLINGIRFSSYQNGVVDVSLIPVDVIDKVEIIHSNLSSLYGADAIGGVVNIITKRTGNLAWFDLSSGSFGFRKFKVGFSNQLKNFSYFSVFSRTYGPGSFDYYYKLGDRHIKMKRKNAHFSITNLYLNFSVQNNVSISSLYVRSNRGIPAQVVKFDPVSSAWQLDEDFSLSISTSKTLKSGAIRVTTMFRNSYLRYVNNDILISGSGIDSYFRNIFYTGFVNLLLNLGPNFLFSSGFESSFGITRGNSLEKARRLNVALYFSGEREIKALFLPATKVYPMLRIDYFSDFGSRVVYKVGFNSKIIEEPLLNFKFSYGTGFRAPTFNDLYWYGSGNKSLRPEKSIGYDLGFVAKIESKVISKMKFEISFFDINVEDRIVWLPYQGYQSLWRPINIDRVNTKGAEFSGTINLFDRLSISGNFSVVKSVRTNKRASDDATQNKYLIYIPKSAGNFMIELDLLNFFLIAQANYVGIRYATELNDRWLQPYIVVDFVGGVNMKGKFFEGQAKIVTKNAFNENYETMIGYPMPLRSFIFELSIKIKQNGGTDETS